MAEELDKVNVVILGRNYPVRISGMEKDYLDEEVRKINDMIRSFQLKYANKDKQDCLSMALLTYAMQLRSNNENNPSNLINEELEKLNQLIAEHITP